MSLKDHGTGRDFLLLGTGGRKGKKSPPICKEEIRELQASQDNLITGMVMEEVLMEVTSKHWKAKKVTRTACMALPGANCNLTNLTYEMTTFQYLKGAYHEVERDSSAAVATGQGVIGTN